MKYGYIKKEKEQLKLQNKKEERNDKIKNRNHPIFILSFIIKKLDDF